MSCCSNYSINLSELDFSKKDVHALNRIVSDMMKTVSGNKKSPIYQGYKVIDYLSHCVTYARHSIQKVRNTVGVASYRIGAKNREVEIPSPDPCEIEHLNELQKSLLVAMEQIASAIKEMNDVQNIADKLYDIVWTYDRFIGEEISLEEAETRIKEELIRLGKWKDI